MLKTKIYLFILLQSLVILSCKSDPDTIIAKKKFVISDSLLRTLQIDSVSIQQVENTLTLTGQVTFNEDKVARIFPMVSGNITGITAQLGDYVKQGQLLGIINSGEMADYANDLITAKTNLLIAKKNLDASEDMYKSGLASQKDLITAQEMYNQTQAQVNRSNQVLQVYGGNTSGKYELKSPINGFIVEKQINNDMAIRPDNANDLFTISDLKDVWVIANVYESNISRVHLGDQVDITTLSYPDKVFHGTIDKIMNMLDPTNKVMKVRIVLPNPDYALKPQMFASVTVKNKTNQTSLCVPSSTIIFVNNQYYVLHLKSQSEIIITPVQLLGTSGNQTYITGNVTPGDKLIGSNAILIYSALNS
ncbi:MAG: efflux RND transporter periplasmic adaptor subunit [Bacteroidetes bacterium]|nr:efflux RND transporter periplasmic adaptor subunit [Bacteroidota bacterium]